MSAIGRSGFGLSPSAGHRLDWADDWYASSLIGRSQADQWENHDVEIEVCFPAEILQAESKETLED